VIGGLFAWYVLSRESVVPEAGAICTLVIDRTGSSDTESVRENYLVAADKAVKGCRENAGVLSIYSIDGASGRSTLVGGPYEFFDEEETKDAVAQRTFADREAEALAQATTLIGQEAGSGGGSEILSALEETAKATNSAYADNAAPKYLIILTDGLQNSPTRGITISGLVDGTQTVDELLAETETAGMAPSSLSGTCVNMVGVLAGEGIGGVPLDSAAEREIQQYWRTVLTGAGATLSYYGSEPLVLPAKQGC